MNHRSGPRRLRQEGQILVIFILGLLVLVGGIALVLEGGNAYVNQRGVQNGADAAANAGTVVLAQRLAGVTKTDADVNAAVLASSGFNSITSVAYYTNVSGKPIDASGNVVAANLAVVVGVGPIPPNAQGVHVGGNRTFNTSIGRVIGINSFNASAEATAITGKATGGQFLPVVFPVNITDCSGNGNLGVGQSQWPTSQPGVPPAHPVGQEFIVPLCKTGGGSFMVLDLDGQSNNCDDEVTNPPFIFWPDFPVWVDSDNGNNCAKKMEDPINALHGHTVTIPICDDTTPPGCNTQGGSHAQYHVTGVTSFYIDYMSDSNNPNNSLCQAHNNADGGTIVPISGNGSSSCIAGWFVRFIFNGPVGTGTVGNNDAIAIQLIQ